MSGRAIILCADDYGMTSGIDRAILALAVRQRLSAISCLVDGETWPGSAASLKPLIGIEIGLHVVLTDGRRALAGASWLAPDGRFRGRMRLLVGALSARIGRPTLRREIEAQIARFRECMGRYPDFVDTHQTVHLYPGIGPVLIEVIAGADAAWRPWLRVCAEPLWNIAARKHGCGEAIVASVGSQSVARAAHRFGIRVNEGFSGFYDVSRASEFPEIFPSFLSGLGPRHLVMCHPGFCDTETERKDVWMRNREHEFAYLSSGAFLDCLNAHRVELKQFDAVDSR